MPLRRAPHRPDLSHGFVIAGLTRNPVVVWHWIPDVEAPDLIRGRDDKTKGRGTFAESPIASPSAHHSGKTG
jgi:hypothetical protein